MVKNRNEWIQKWWSNNHKEYMKYEIIKKINQSISIHWKSTYALVFYRNYHTISTCYVERLIQRQEYSGELEDIYRRPIILHQWNHPVWNGQTIFHGNYSFQIAQSLHSWPFWYNLFAICKYKNVEFKYNFVWKCVQNVATEFSSVMAKWTAWCKISCCWLWLQIESGCQTYINTHTHTFSHSVEQLSIARFLLNVCVWKS